MAARGIKRSLPGEDATDTNKRPNKKLHLSANHDPSSNEGQFLRHGEASKRGLRNQCLAVLLQLSQRPQAIVMTRTQFDHLSNAMKKRVGVSPVLYYMGFYPKSGHMTGNGYVYLLPVLPIEYDYYRWYYGPMFLREWIAFAERIAGKKCSYVLYDHKTSEFLSVDEESGEILKGRGVMGSGRLYYEALACPFRPIEKLVVM